MWCEATPAPTSHASMPAEATELGVLVTVTPNPISGTHRGPFLTSARPLRSSQIVCLTQMAETAESRILGHSNRIKVALDGCWGVGVGWLLTTMIRILTFLIKRHQALIDHCVLKRVPEGREFL